MSMGKLAGVPAGSRFRFAVSRAEHGLENFGASLYAYGKYGRPEWIRTIDLFRVKEALWTN